MTVVTSTPHGPSTDSALVVPLCDDDATVAAEFALRDRLEAALAARPARVVVDLERCRYLDLPGLRVLVGARHQAAQQGTRLELRRASPEVLRLLQAAGSPPDLWQPAP